MRNFLKHGVKKKSKFLIISVIACILLYIQLPIEYHCYYTLTVDVLGKGENIKRVLYNKGSCNFVLEKYYHNDEIRFFVKKIGTYGDSINIDGINYIMNKNIGESWFSSCENALVDQVKVTAIKRIDTTINKIEFSDCILYNIDWIKPEKRTNVRLVLIDNKTKMVIYDKHFSNRLYASSELKLDSVIRKKTLLSYMFFVNNY